MCYLDENKQKYHILNAKEKVYITCVEKSMLIQLQFDFFKEKFFQQSKKQMNIDRKLC